MEFRTSEFQPTNQENHLEVDDLVEIIMLENKPEYNHHVGKVRVASVNKGAKCLITLHSSIWPLSNVVERDNSDEDGDGNNMLSDSKTVSVHLSNIRRINQSNSTYQMRHRTVSKNTIKIFFGSKSARLSDDIACYISEFLQVAVVNSVVVTRCSSTAAHFPLEAVLDDSRRTWWISSSDNIRGVLGEEYLEFSFGPTVRRVNYIGIRIPPLPQGPLSVREFHIMALSELVDPNSADALLPESWRLCSQKPLITLDQADLQEFCMHPPIDAKMVRLVCTKNAAHDTVGPLYNCVGLFSVFFR